MVELIIGLVAGFVAGALVFRNNAKKGEALVAKVQAEAAELKDKAKSLRK
jgi:uncharacterized membrane protein YeaQ/YmgE (transglycosylase-associated protein family)